MAQTENLTAVGLGCDTVSDLVSEVTRPIELVRFPQNFHKECLQNLSTLAMHWFLMPVFVSKQLKIRLVSGETRFRKTNGN